MTAPTPAGAPAPGNREALSNHVLNGIDLELMKGETVEPKLHLYPVELMVRESTASPADR